MNLTVRKSLAAGAAVATAGVSSLFLGAAPATAATADGCAPTGTLVAPGVCELVFTEDGTFTPTAQMTKLEVLLVGAGGSGTNQASNGTTGYAAGGGGEVRIVDFGATPTALGELTVTVPAPGAPGGVTGAVVNETVGNGGDGTVTDEGVATGGASGANPGSSVPGVVEPVTAPYGAGGGAGGAASGADGGAGIVVNALAPAGSLFAGDERCFAGGGAVAVTGVTGIPGCGGGYPTEAGGTLVAPVANSGGGAGALTPTETLGATGVVIFRWNTPALAATGDAPNAAALPIGLSALLAGAGLVVLATRRRREAD